MATSRAAPLAAVSQVEPQPWPEPVAAADRPLRIQTLRSALPASLRQQLQSARELARSRAEAPPTLLLSTSLRALDRLLEGGLPRGRLVELVGRRSSGRFSSVLSLLATATSAGEVAALVDLGDGLDPQAAATAGVVLERLLWARPRHLRQALIGTEMLLGAGFPLVVLDLGNPPVPGGRGAAAAWLRLGRAAESQEAALLVASPYRVSGTAAEAVLAARRGHPAWYGSGPSPRLLTGLSSRLSREKLRGRSGTPSASLRLTLPAAAGLTATTTLRELPPAPADQSANRQLTGRRGAGGSSPARLEHGRNEAGESLTRGVQAARTRSAATNPQASLPREVAG